MKNTMFKIAGVKNEKAFYKKFPTKKAFMSKHGKTFKAKYGAMIKAQGGAGIMGKLGGMMGGGGGGAAGGLMGKAGGNSPVGAYISAATDIVGGIGELSAQKDAVAVAEQDKRLSEIAVQTSELKDVDEDKQRIANQERNYNSTMQTVNGEELFPVNGVGTNVLAKYGAKVKANESLLTRMPDYQSGGKLPTYFGGGAISGIMGAGASSAGSTAGGAAGGIMGKMGGASGIMGAASGLFGAIGGALKKNIGAGGSSGAQVEPGAAQPQQQMATTAPAPIEEKQSAGGFGEFMQQKGGSDILTKAVSGIQGDDAGSKIGGGIGMAAGTAIFGPLGGVVGKFAGKLIGGAIDRSDSIISKSNDIQDANNERIQGTDFAKFMNTKNEAFTEHGGKISNGNNGDVVPLAGGNISIESYNPYTDGGETGMINGRSHAEGGVKLHYAGNKIEAQGNEPFIKMKEGGQAENLVIFGDLPISKETASLIGDDKARGKQFQTYVKDIAKNEEKINKTLKSINKKELKYAGTSTGVIEEKTRELRSMGADMKLKRFAELKESAGHAQQAIHDTAEELGIDDQKLVARGGDKLGKKLSRISNKRAKVEREEAFAQTGFTIPPVSSELDGYTPNEFPELQSLEPEIIEEEVQEEVKTPKSKRTITGGKGTGDVKGSVRGGFDSQSKNKDGGYGNADKKSQDSFIRKHSGWFDFDDFDFNNSEDVKRLQEGINARTSGNKVTVDGKFGNQTSSYFEPIKTEAREPKLMETELQEPDLAIRPIGVEEVESEVVNEGFNPMPLINSVMPAFRKSDAEGLNQDQLYGEMFALSNNKVEPVQARLYKPTLDVPYDISLQDQLNRNTSNVRGAQKMALGSGNPASQAMVQAQSFKNEQTILANQFRLNQGKKDQVYSGNRATLNDAQLKNLAIMDQQYVRQATAKSNTKAATQSALSSISDKYAKNRLEQRKLKTWENMYNYRFGKNYVAKNRNDMVDFDAMWANAEATLGSFGTKNKNKKDKDSAGAVEPDLVPIESGAYGKHGSIVRAYKRS